MYLTIRYPQHQLLDNGYSFKGDIHFGNDIAVDPALKRLCIKPC